MSNRRGGARSPGTRLAVDDRNPVDAGKLGQGDSFARRRSASFRRMADGQGSRRLEHARQHANLIIETDGLTANEVLENALEYLKHRN